METAECGAAVLTSILRYFGHFETLATVRELCGVSRNGTNFLAISEVAEKLGLIVQGNKVKSIELKKLKFPMIALWQKSHAVVLEGVGIGGWFINDPAKGHIIVSDTEFQEKFSNVVMTLSPGPNFKPKKPPLALQQRIIGLFLSEKRLLACVIALSAVLGFVSMSIPYIMKNVIDNPNIVFSEFHSIVAPIFFGFLFATVLFVAWFRSNLLLKFETKLSGDRAESFMLHAIKLPISFFSQRFSAEIGSRVLLNQKIARFVVSDLANIIFDFMSMVFVLTMMLCIDWLLSILAIAFLCLNFVIIRKVLSFQRRLASQALNENGKLRALSVSGLKLMETIRGGGRESEFLNSWLPIQDSALNAVFKLSRTRRIVSNVPEFMLGLALVCSLIVSIYQYEAGAITLGDLVAFQPLMLALISPVTRIIGVLGQIQMVHAQFERLDDVLQHSLNEKNQCSLVTIGHHCQVARNVQSFTLELRDVSFGYTLLKPPIIQNVSLELKPGAITALTGPSGCGKSTIGMLVAGYYQPWKGSVRIATNQLSADHGKEWTRRVGWVGQDGPVFKGTLRENLSLFENEIPDSELLRCLCLVGLRSWCSSLPRGLESTLMGGRQLNGEQRQQLSLARALLKSPRYLILDEALNAIRPVQTERILRSIKTINIGCLVISHNPLSLSNIDSLYLLQDHSLIEINEIDDKNHALNGMYTNKDSK